MQIQRLSFLIFSSLVIATKATTSSNEDNRLSKLFDDWSEKFGRNYSTKEEKQKRLSIWIDNHGMKYS